MRTLAVPPTPTSSALRPSAAATAACAARAPGDERGSKSTASLSGRTTASMAARASSIASACASSTAAASGGAPRGGAAVAAARAAAARSSSVDDASSSPESDAALPNAGHPAAESTPTNARSARRARRRRPLSQRTRGHRPPWHHRAGGEQLWHGRGAREQHPPRPGGGPGRRRRRGRRRARRRRHQRLAGRTHIHAEEGEPQGRRPRPHHAAGGLDPGRWGGAGRPRSPAAAAAAASIKRRGCRRCLHRPRPRLPPLHQHRQQLELKRLLAARPVADTPHPRVSSLSTPPSPLPRQQRVHGGRQVGVHSPHRGVHHLHRHIKGGGGAPFSDGFCGRRGGGPHHHPG